MSDHPADDRHASEVVLHFNVAVLIVGGTATVACAW
jgi:hypothetical protein